jgi:hypothetical protein
MSFARCQEVKQLLTNLDLKFRKIVSGKCVIAVIVVAFNLLFNLFMNQAKVAEFANFAK